jgi:hypothetical protein
MRHFMLTALILSVMFEGKVVLAQPPSAQARLHRGASNSVLAAQMRAAGLMRERSQVESLVDVVNENVQEKNVFVALRALSRIGDVRAMPLFDRVEARVAQPTTKEFLKIMKARHFVEQRSQGRKSSSLTEAQSQLNTFISQLDLSLVEFKRKYSRLAENRRGRLRGNILNSTLLLSREIADLIYIHRDTFLLQAANDAEIDLSSDTLVALKVRLAFLPPQERINTLLAELSSNKFTGYLDFEDAAFTVRLLVDMGAPAQQSIKARLERLRTDRAASEDEFTASLISAYAMFSTNRQSSVVTDFKNDRSEQVRGAAEVLERRIQQNEPHDDLITWRY